LVKRLTPTMTQYVEFENGIIAEYKSDWETEEILGLEEKVHNVVEIAIVNSLPTSSFGKPSEEEVEAARHFLKTQGDRLHPSHRISLNNIIRRGEEK